MSLPFSDIHWMTRWSYNVYSYSIHILGSVNTVDIFFGDTTDNRFSSYITLNGFCHRMSYMVSKISYHEVHEYIWDLVKRRYIPNTSKYYTDGDQGPDYRPYDLQLTSSFGTDQRGPLATGNNLFRYLILLDSCCEDISYLIFFVYE